MSTSARFFAKNGLDNNSKTITNVADPVNNQDVATKWYVLNTAAPINPVCYENNMVISENYTLTAGKNGVSAGPVAVADGFTVTIPDGSTWTIV